MILRRSLLAVPFAHLLLACGGVASQDGAGGSGGYSGGGTDAGGTIACSNIILECPAGERYALDSECPGLATCHEVPACYGSRWCVPVPRVCPAGADTQETGPSHDCNGITCTASQACVVSPDYSPQGFVYQCTELCGACRNQPVTCACAQPPPRGPGVCATGYEICSEPGPGVDGSAQVQCEPPIK
jgi:hypothetical protein